MRPSLSYLPEGKDFIFTIFDDTDVSTLGNIKPIYDFLDSVSIYTTKSVWPLRHKDPNSDYFGSHTLQDDLYAEYVKSLSQRGFEIAFHGATMESSTREMTEKALLLFHDKLGFYPRTYACHAVNRENIAWGEDRFKWLIFRKLYSCLNPNQRGYFCGGKEGSPFFWGDLCHKYFDYVRTFTYSGINLFNITKKPLYVSQHNPYYKQSFITCDADNVEEFNNLISEKNQEKLYKENGLCIISTHFGKGFVKNGKLNETTRKLLIMLSKKNGMFAPVSQVLDTIKDRMLEKKLTKRELFFLELKWFMHSFIRKKSKQTYEKSELSYLYTNNK